MLCKSTTFPRAWLWLIDELIPVRVKKQYSPRDSWKDKPFSKEDARFFFKGVDELSTLFTEERLKGMPAYFAHPKFRSAYMLYFLPLQAAKFLTLFQNHSQAIEAALENAKKSGVLRIADIGVGPGTGSLSLLLALLDWDTQTSGPRQDLPQIELHWCDTHASIMKDGLEMVEQLASQFPRLRGKVQVHTHVMPWWKSASHLPDDLSLVLMGHILNESTVSQQNTHAFWKTLLGKSKGGGILMIEPASRKTSQQLSHLRNNLFEDALIERTPETIWGPCLHAEACPLGEGRDWCHFSVPVQIPGRWFKEFSIGLGSERQWVKFSYLWLASQNYPAPTPEPQMRRVVSDALSQGNLQAGPKAMTTVLLCEPEAPARWSVPLKDHIGRGDIIRVP